MTRLEHHDAVELRDGGRVRRGFISSPPGSEGLAECLFIDGRGPERVPADRLFVVVTDHASEAADLAGRGSPRHAGDVPKVLPGRTRAVQPGHRVLARTILGREVLGVVVAVGRSGAKVEPDDGGAALQVPFSRLRIKPTVEAASSVEGL